MSRALLLIGSWTVYSCAGAKPAPSTVGEWSVVPSGQDVPLYQRLELVVKAPHGHALGTEQVTATFVPPSGRAISQPGFQAQGSVRFRFAPRELGRYKYEVLIRRADRTVYRSEGWFSATQSAKPGFVRVNEKNPRYLRHDDGSQVHLIGENRFNVYDPTWNYQAQDLETYIAGMAQRGENGLRIFMFSDCDDESRPDGKQPGCLEPRVGFFDEDVANVYDRLFAAAEQHGVLVVLSLFAVGFTPDDVWKGWEDNPYSAARGGPAQTPYDFFVAAEPRQAAMNRMHYVLARWGASSALLAIDLINEPEWDGAIGEETWTAWAEDLARSWHARDRYGHLITVGSVGLHWNLDGDERAWYGSRENDIVQWHLYGEEFYEVHALAHEITRKIDETDDYGKPVLIGEFAYGGEDKQTYDHTHVGIWTASFCGAGVLAHSAPPFTEDSDEPMTPERGKHMRVLRDFLSSLGTVHGPIAKSKIEIEPASVAAWGLSAQNATALWLLAPLAGYGEPISGTRVRLSGLPCEDFETELWDDVSGQQLGTAVTKAARSGEEAAEHGCRAEIDVPSFRRHVALRVKPRKAASDDASRQ